MQAGNRGVPPDTLVTNYPVIIGRCACMRVPHITLTFALVCCIGNGSRPSQYKLQLTASTEVIFDQWELLKDRCNASADPTVQSRGNRDLFKDRVTTAGDATNRARFSQGEEVRMSLKICVSHHLKYGLARDLCCQRDSFIADTSSFSR